MRRSGVIATACGRRSGLTLVEMLVVLAVIGTAAGLVVLSVGGRDAALAHTEANRLADRLRLAADEALISDRPVHLLMDPRGYAFQSGATGADDWGARHDLPAGVRLAADSGRVLVDPDSATPPATMTVRDRRQVWVVTFDGLNADVRPSTPEVRS